MSRSRKTQLIAPFLCALLIPGAALAHRPGGGGDAPMGKACKPFRPNQPPVGTPVSHAMPKVHRPSAKVTTWGTQTTWDPIRHTTYQPTYNRDPYKLEMKGYNEGSKVTLKLQQKSGKVQLPESCPGCAGGKTPKKLTNPAKWAKKQRSKAWRQAVSKALKFEQLEQFQVTVPSHAQTQTEQRANIMPTHTPYKVEGRDAFNRKYATIQGNAEGLTTAVRRTSRQQRVGGYNYNQSGAVSDSGLHVPAYDVKANTNTENLYVTPAYQKGGTVQSKVLGLAAFPAGAKVSITNTRMEGAGEASHTVSFTASKSGSGGIVVPGMQRDKLRVTVSFDAVKDKAAASAYSFNTRIPAVAGRPAFQARGINYYSVGLE
jgi:hypothetical protein